ncbi:MAG TPA: ammonia-forming cytochrome c nitrite reductase subunit c552, partial [Luteitalea sp.]|nr:ammonia-forming cytochrome c nitrite reductase subunit c552 [Luteitalea sp.]
GGLKVSDHHVRSPLLNINRACQTCHKWSEDELKARAETLQERVFGLRNRAMDALMALIGDVKAARSKGATDAQLDEPRRQQRAAQFLLDFVEAENSVGFHAPEEAERLLAISIDFSRQGQIALLRGGAPAPEVPKAPAGMLAAPVPTQGPAGSKSGPAVTGQATGTK